MTSIDTSSGAFDLKKDGLDALGQMMTIREFESRLPGLSKEGFIRGSTHPSVGQEAIAVGVSRLLRDTDYIASTHRGHAHVLAKGGELGRTMAEILGRSDGYCGGKGGSMHIGIDKLGVLGTNGIVGAGIGLSVGAGLSAQMEQKGGVSIAYFGDGASNQGVLAESFNLAATWKLPVLFICENNHFAQSAAIEDTTAQTDLRLRGEAFGVPSVDVDGMDITEVHEVATKALSRAREGGGPTFIVADTYRYLGHMADDTEIYRTREQVEEWRGRDPIANLASRLIVAGLAEQAGVDNVSAAAVKDVDAAVAFAKNSPYPDVKEAFTCVYKERTS